MLISSFLINNSLAYFFSVSLYQRADMKYMESNTNDRNWQMHVMVVSHFAENVRLKTDKWTK